MAEGNYKKHAPVFVQRSDGTESFGHVVSFDMKSGNYEVRADTRRLQFLSPFARRRARLAPPFFSSFKPRPCTLSRRSHQFVFHFISLRAALLFFSLSSRAAQVGLGGIGSTLTKASPEHMMRSATAEEVAANPPRYADGCPLMVTRSDGTKSECTVLAYDAPHKAYKVSVDGTDITKMAAEKMLE